MTPLRVAFDTGPLYGPRTGVGFAVEAMHAALAARDDVALLDIGGVAVDGGLAQQHRPPQGRQPADPLGVDRPDRFLDREQVLDGEPLRDPSSGPRSRRRHRLQLLTGSISATPVQPGHEVDPGQLGARHRDQQLTAVQATASLLQRCNRIHTIADRGRDPQRPVQLPDRLDPCRRCQPGIGLTNDHPTRPTPTLLPRLDPTYRCHRKGAFHWTGRRCRNPHRSNPEGTFSL